jgi:signal transduction histidine kinase
VPQPASASADDPLAGDDPVALTKLRDDPNAGLSASGLPRRVLAALRLLELAPDSQSPESLAELVVAVPSVLTTGVLERLGEPARLALTKWREAETALALIAEGNGWHFSGDAAWWVERRDDGVVYLTPEARSAALREHAAKLPPWAGLELVTDPATQNTAPVLAAAPVSFGGGLSLQVTAVSPALIEREVRRQAAWTLSLLGGTVASACLALWLMLRAVRQERRLAALKSQFVSSVSHELRAPIGSIRLMAEALHDGKVAGGAAREFHRLIAGESARLSQMVENVLDFARIEEGRKRYQFEETDLQQLAADTLRLLAPLAAERGITLVPELSCVTATVDPAAIQQALVNLLDNAIKFSPEGGTVTVGLEEAAPALPQDAEGSTRDACGPRWVLSVRDQGPGIPPAERERIFERFYRLGNELRRETQGAGIGLSIVKHIAEGHGGRVAVCEGEGGLGSVFTIKTQDCKTQDARLEQA